MYSPSSPCLSSIDNSSNLHQHHNLYQNQHHQPASQCMSFKYFATFLISTTCLALLSCSLATHKWIVSKPIRILRLNGGQTNLTSLMLNAQSDQVIDRQQYSHSPLLSSLSSSLNDGDQGSELQLELDQLYQQQQQQQHNKFQGEIYFGLFKGLKVLNYGFGDRSNQISVIQNQFAKDNNPTQNLVNFKLWLLTLAGVALGILFALIGSIFAIINFVMTPRGTLTGPVGLVIWNASACFSCLLALVSWLVEYFVHLQANVLTQEEVQNGWTSEKRSQFGYSYYLVVLAFILHLVNIFIVSIVQFESWTNSEAAKRHSRAVCEGVIMLY